jgi:hypothetical protein
LGGDGSLCGTQTLRVPAKPSGGLGRGLADRLGVRAGGCGVRGNCAHARCAVLGSRQGVAHGSVPGDAAPPPIGRERSRERDLSGHADITVTLKIYAHVLPGDDKDAALRADELLGEIL